VRTVQCDGTSVLTFLERAGGKRPGCWSQRLARRHTDSRPVIDELRAWIDTQRDVIPPKTPLGSALGYLHRQWRRLLLFLDDGNIEPTNNRRERELRRLLLGRRNWLFTWLDEGGERTAAILTIIATCIAHSINPRAYLHLVTKLIAQGFPQAKLRDLLPDRLLAEHPELYIGDRDAVPALAAA
jgi:transposase